MFVQKMPMAAGFEGFPFIPSFQAEASLIVKAGCGSKRKAEEDGGEVTVKAKAAAEKAPVTLKAKASAEEEAAFTTVKAKAEEEAPVTLKAKEAEEAALTLKAKAGEVNKVVLADPMWEEVEYSYCDSDEEVDSDDEDTEAFLARIRSEFNAHAEKLKADNPWLKWGDYDPEEYSADDYFRCKQEEEAGAVVDGLVSV